MVVCSMDIHWTEVLAFTENKQQGNPVKVGLRNDLYDLFPNTWHTIKYTLISHTILISTLSFILIRPKSLFQLLKRTMFQAFNFGPGQSKRSTWSLKITASVKDLEPLWNACHPELSWTWNEGCHTVAWSEPVHLSSVPAAPGPFTCSVSLKNTRNLKVES